MFLGFYWWWHRKDGFKKFRSWKSYSILLLEIQRWKLLQITLTDPWQFCRSKELINSDRKHCQSHPIFENKYLLQPIIAKSPMDVCQIDLVIMEKHPSKGYNNKTYFCILNVIDVFSRYIFLKPLQSKESLEVASHLWEIFLSVGIPNVIQCDHGSEFKGRNF